MAGENNLSRVVKFGMIGPCLIEVVKSWRAVFLLIRYLNLEIDNIFPRSLMISDQFVQELSRSELLDDL